MQVCIVPTPTGGTACPDPLNNFSLTTTAVLYQQPRYFTGLDSGTPYTVTVTNISPVATRFISLDAILVEAPIASLGAGFARAR